MILRSRGGDVEARALGISDAATGNWLDSGSFRSYGSAVALPAVASAVRLVAEEIAGFVMRVYTGDATNRQPVPTARQNMLFQYPSDGWTSFDLWSDTVTALELYRNAFIWKTKTSRGVEELIPLDPDVMMVKVERGIRKVYGRVNGNQRDLTSQVIHIRGWSQAPGSAEGDATTDLHARTFRTAMAYEEFRGTYFDNDATPGIVISVQGTLNLDQRKDLLRAWMIRHQGPKNAGLPGLLWGGAEIKQLTNSMRDSQGAESAEAIVKDVARAFRIFPAELLMQTAASTGDDAEAMADKFFRFSILPRIRRIEAALKSDPDLFPDRALYPNFDTSKFTRGSVTTEANKAHALRQAGMITANEGRAELGYPPRPDGDELQLTPVGGESNQP